MATWNVDDCVLNTVHANGTGAVIFIFVVLKPVNHSGTEQLRICDQIHALNACGKLGRKLVHEEGVTAGLPEPEQKDQDMTVVSTQLTRVKKPGDLALGPCVEGSIHLVLLLTEDSMHLFDDLGRQLQNRLTIDLGLLRATKTDRFDQDTQLLHGLLTIRSTFNRANESLGASISICFIKERHVQAYRFELFLIVVRPNAKEAE